MKRDEQREALLQGPCHVIDVLPCQVPKHSPGRFDQVEQYFLTGMERERQARQWVRLLCKLLCYFDAQIYAGRWMDGISCPALAARIQRIATEGRGELSLLFSTEDALVQMAGDDLHLTVYHATGRFQEMVQLLTAAEGLFWREGCQ